MRAFINVILRFAQNDKWILLNNLDYFKLKSLRRPQNMDGIELFPTLSHCIETTAREEFWNSVDQYMEGGQKDKKLEEKIELLKAFLESMDFKKLRSQSEKYLIEGKTVKFVICWKTSRPDCQMIVIEGD